MPKVKPQEDPYSETHTEPLMPHGVPAPKAELPPNYRFVQAAAPLVKREDRAAAPLVKREDRAAAPPVKREESPSPLCRWFGRVLGKIHGLDS